MFVLLIRVDNKTQSLHSRFLNNQSRENITQGIQKLTELEWYTGNPRMYDENHQMRGCKKVKDEEHASDGKDS